MLRTAIGDKHRRRARGEAKAPPAATRVTKADRSHLSPVEDRGRPADAYEPLVQAAIGGDARALEALLVRVQGLAYRFSVTVCGNADGADDVMQEALIRTYRRVGQIRDLGAFKPWLYRTVRNACLMSRRRRVNEPRHFESIDRPASERWPDRPIEVPDPSPGPEAAAVNLGRRRRLRAAIKRLPPSYRAVVLLREVEGLSTREVAAALSLSEANVKQRLHRARVMLQASLADLEGE
jgi:RNA polymerase sigma-70 factor, ECF subfamily